MATLPVVPVGGQLALVANNTVDVDMNERHQSFMQSCCAEGRCFKNFINLDTRIMDVDPTPLFQYLHSNDNGVFVHSTQVLQLISGSSSW